MKRRLRLGALGLAIVLGVAGLVAYANRVSLIRAYIGLPDFTHRAGVVETTAVILGDGARLETRVHLPRGGQRWPTILVRDPYGVSGFLCQFVVRYGYACVGQSVRGRGESTGEFYPFVTEHDDGIETLRWLTQQGFQDGNIAMLGASYLGIVQLAVADSLPPEVKTLIPMMAHGDIYSLAYEGGLFQHAVASAWAAANAKDPDEAMWRAFRARPAPRSARDLGVELPWFDDWVEHQAGDEAYWQADRYARLRSAHRRASVPILYIAGWYDFFLEGQLRVFDELPTRHRSRLLIGPSGHVGQRGDLPMSGDFGLKFLVPEILAWLDHHLRGARPPEPARGVTTYVVGGGDFVHRDRWPPETTPLPFYLQPADASIDCPKGRLGSEPVAQRQGLTFTYDPANPVPSRGGSKSLWAELGGPSFQDEPCQRDDIVTFLSEPLESPLHIAGAVEVRLIVASDRPDTTFVSRLSESREDGATYLVRERATTLGFRNGSRARQPYEPGRPVELVMRMAPIERVIPAGARLRLDVTSSSFPAFHVHPNHAGPWHVAGSAARAEQTVQVGGADGPRVLLPVLAE